MVTIVDYSQRKNSEGKDFYSLILQGGIEMVKSKETDRYYATAKRCSITSTFDESTCKVEKTVKLTTHFQFKLTTSFGAK